MGFRGGVKLTPPQHILVFKYPSRDRVNYDSFTYICMSIVKTKTELVSYSVMKSHPFSR